MTAPDYGWYTSVFHGQLDETAFYRYSERAWAYVDRLTLGRASAQDADAIRMAVCEVAEEMAREEQGRVVSESNDGVSVSYERSAAQTRNRRLYDAAALYLSGTGLLYRGVC